MIEEKRPLIFVFGSNLEGIHGAGAAKEARDKYGAIFGQGIGLQGNSYAIPTKSSPYETLPISEIAFYVTDFLKFAAEHQEYVFKLTNIGCGLAGYEPAHIAPLFYDPTRMENVSNVYYSEEFENINEAIYWHETYKSQKVKS